MVELPSHHYLFALLTYNAFLARNVFKDRIIEAVHAPGERWAGALSRLRESRVMDPKHYPLLVTFTDITAPMTVKQVDPEDLAATFGPGVSLKRITLEITDEPVTEGKIEQVLGWLRPHPETTLGRSKDIFKPIFAATVHHGDFIRR